MDANRLLTFGTSVCSGFRVHNLSKESKLYNSVLFISIFQKLAHIGGDPRRTGTKRTARQVLHDCVSAGTSSGYEPATNRSLVSRSRLLPPFVKLGPTSTGTRSDDATAIRLGLPRCHASFFSVSMNSPSCKRFIERITVLRLVLVAAAIWLWESSAAAFWPAERTVFDKKSRRCGECESKEDVSIRHRIKGLTRF